MIRTPSPEGGPGPGGQPLPPGITALPAGLGWLVDDRATAIRLLSDDRVGVVASGPVMSLLGRGVPADLAPAVADIAEFAGRIMLQAEPDHHRHLRKGFAPFFTAEAVDDMVPTMREDAERVVAAFVDAGGGDFMTAVAFPYAVAVAARLLGVSSPEYVRLHQLSKRVAMVAYAMRAPDREQVVRDGHAALTEMRRAIAAARATAPDGSVLGTWRTGGITGMTDPDVEANVVMLVQATLETVAGMLGNAALWILRTPGALVDPRAREELVDESLRHQPPLKTLERATREAVEVDGLRLPAGKIVTVRVAEANLGGGDGTAVAGNAVLSFGWGAYRCLGARMARYQAAELFSALAERAPGARLTDPEPEYVRHIRFSMPRLLPVRIPPADAPRQGAHEVTLALTEALEEHDLDRPLTSLEQEVAVLTLAEFGVPEPESPRRLTTIRGWVEWATATRG
ncbi:cytochrome P450 [Micromonospora sp. ATCC 39149]|uniref:Cytochrome P450 n=1 Tax=Micromonospora carbonacea TaxID=47853 RepID=A0A7D6CE44_9ACTN|nr:cytochrome P450 [Micromonospora sp. ATCC 39149]EEP73614.1 cytochrome P450 [Micromonospora sp. ATCC 39149]QLJ99530.1 cytochrome P450 [Micromonospora carbonacea]